MYFKDRAEAGKKLFKELQQYRYEDCIVISLSQGGVQVGEQIAVGLHCLLTMLLIEDINLPGTSENVGTISQSGSFVYNDMLSAGEIEGYYSEFHGYIEQEKREKMSHINSLLGDGGIVSNDMVRDRVVILVSDGMSNGASLTAAVDFLKPIRVQKIVAAVPVVSVPAVDKLHLLTDEIHVLSVIENFFDTNHYYEDNRKLDYAATIKRINNTILNWR